MNIIKGLFSVLKANPDTTWVCCSSNVPQPAHVKSHYLGRIIVGLEPKNYLITVEQVVSNLGQGSGCRPISKCFGVGAYGKGFIRSGIAVRSYFYLYRVLIAVRRGCVASMIYKVGRLAFQAPHIEARSLPVGTVQGGLCACPNIDIPLVGKGRFCGFHIPVFACGAVERGGSSSGGIIAGQPVCVRYDGGAGINLCDSDVRANSHRNQGKSLHLKSYSVVQFAVDTMRAGRALSSGGRHHAGVARIFPVVRGEAS